MGRTYMIGELPADEEKSLVFHSLEAAQKECENTGQNKNDITEIIILTRKEVEHKLTQITKDLKQIKNIDLSRLETNIDKMINNR